MFLTSTRVRNVEATEELPAIGKSYINYSRGSEQGLYD
jgi:hypothetical protein